MEPLRFLLLSVLLLAFQTGIYAREDAPLIRDVNFKEYSTYKNVSEVNRLSYLSLIENKPGTRLKIRALENHDMEVLEESGIQVQKLVKQSNEDGSVSLTLFIEKLPRIIGHEFENMPEYDKFTFSLVEFRYFNENLIITVNQIVKNHLAKYGYPFGGISKYEKIWIGDNVKIKWHVYRGNKTELAGVIFQHDPPTPMFSDYKLLEVGDFDVDGLTSMGYFIPHTRWLDSAPYNKRNVQEGVIKIQEFYRSRGWLDAKVFVTHEKTDSKMQDKYVYIRIVPGSRYVVRSIKIKGNKVLSTDKILEKIRLKEKGFYLKHKLYIDYKGGKREDQYGDIRMLQQTYSSLGYLECRIMPEEDFNVIKDKNGKRIPCVDLTFKIDEGKPVYWNRIRIQGNYRTKDKVIRRELVTRPLHKASLIDLEYSKLRLQQLGHFGMITYKFEDPEDILANPTGTDSNVKLKDLIWNIEEGKTINFKFSGGINSNIGLVGTISVSWRNFDFFNYPKSWSHFFSLESFRGGGQSIEVKYEPADQLHNLSASWYEPYLFDLPVGLGVRYYLNYSGRDGRDIMTHGIRFSLSPRISRYFRFGISYSYEDLRISNLAQYYADNNQDGVAEAYDIPAFLQEKGHNCESNLTVSFSFDYVDKTSTNMPYRGFELSLWHKYAGGFLGGTFHYWQSGATANGYLPINPESSWKHVFHLRLRAMWGQEHTEGFIPEIRKFYGGGLTTVRGFRYRSISPKYYYTAFDNGIPTGGNFMAVANLQYSFPIYQQEIMSRTWDIVRLVFFVDAGNCVDNIHGIENLDAIRVSAGFGIRLIIPLLGPVPLKFDFAWPIRMVRGDETEVFSFSLGGVW